MSAEIENKEVALEPYKLFEVESKNKRSYSFQGKLINLELGVPKNCVELYLQYKAFPYLKLKKGAQVLFQNLPEAELLKLINQIKSESDIKILSNLIESKEGKAIVATRLKELKTPR